MNLLAGLESLTNKERPQYSSKKDSVSSDTSPDEPGREVHDASNEQTDIGCEQVEAQPQEICAQSR